MTITYDPSHPKYFDEVDFRAELERVFDLCHGCRLCLHLCPSFPTLFDYIDSHDGDVAKLTRSESDQVVDECYQCKLCYVKCPYIPPHEWDLDFPRLMLRAKSIRKSRGELSKVEEISDKVLANTDLIGMVSVPLSALVNKLTDVHSTASRNLMVRGAGIAAERVLPPYAKARLSTWYKKRTKPFIAKRKGSVAVYPTCFIEYMEPAIGKAIFGVYERNQISCTLADKAKCCGAPHLHAGDVDKFVDAAKKNIEVLDAEVSAGRSIVVAQPTCAYVIKRDYPLYLKTEKAKRVAANTFDTSEYLFSKYREDKEGFDTNFNGSVPSEITYHAPCHLQAQNIGLKSRDLIKLTGAKIQVVTKCSGIDGTWGYRAKNYALAKRVSGLLAKAIDKAGANASIVGDCHLANYAISEETDKVVSHPMVVMARAYGIEL